MPRPRIRKRPTRQRPDEARLRAMPPSKSAQRNSLKVLHKLPTTLIYGLIARTGVRMAVAALSTAGFSQYIAASSNVSASQQAFQALQQSLASGNLSAAQSAFNAYNQLNQSLTSAASTSTSSSSGGSQLSTDMAALGSAIGSGDLPTAQTAFPTVQSDLKTTPSQSMTNAESAVAQTVAWVDDLLSLSSSNNSSAPPVDPTTAILNSAYGDSGAAGASSSGAAASTPASDALNFGNAGSSASVNVYA